MATSLKEQFLALQPSKDRKEYMLEYAHEELKNMREKKIQWNADDYISVPIPEMFYDRHYKFTSEALQPLNQGRRLKYYEAANTAYDNYSYLVPEVIAERIYEEAFPHLIARQLLDLVTFKGTTYTLQKGVKDSVKAFLIEEGSEIPEQMERYTEETVTPEKYGVRVELTTEMIEDARVNLFPRQIRLAGEAMAKFENTQILGVVTTNGTAYAGAAPITLVQILEMLTQINAQDWDADTVVLHPYQMRELMKTDEWRSAAGRFQANSQFVENALRGQVMNLWGVLDIIVSSTMTAGTAIVMDRKVAGIIAQNRMITAKRYDEPKRDQFGYLATQRLKAKLIWTEAVQVCTTFLTS